MKTQIAAAILALSAVAACAWWSKNVTPIENGVIDCVKAEEAAVGKQVTITQVVESVVEAIVETVASGGDPSPAIDSLIAQYGPTLGSDAQALVACAVKQFATLPIAQVQVTQTGSAATAATLANSAQQVIAKHGWRFK